MKLKILGIVAFLLLLATSHSAVYFWGASNARGSEHSKCQQQTIAGLAETIEETKELMDQSNANNLRLGKTINTMIAANAQSTSEIRRALTTTSHLRIDCVFDDNVMHYIHNAADRADRAASSGIDDAVPTRAAPE